MFLEMIIEIHVEAIENTILKCVVSRHELREKGRSDFRFRLGVKSLLDPQPKTE